MLRRLSELCVSSVLPERVLVSIDGPRSERESRIWKDFDFSTLAKEFPFTLEFIRRPANLGCSLHIITAVSEVLQVFNSVIVVEDDVIVGNGFLKSMIDGLSIISSDDSIGTVGGFSPFYKGLFRTSTNYWRKSTYFSAWGWCTTTEFWDGFVSLSEIENPERVLESSAIWMNLSKRKKRIWMKRFHRGIWDYNVQFMLFLKEKKSLLPKLRLIDNEGFSDLRSTHTKHERPWSLFGEGFCTNEPKIFLESNCFLIRRILWSWIDSNLWAADGYFNARAREMGIRSLFRKWLRL